MDNKITVHDGGNKTSTHIGHCLQEFVGKLCQLRNRDGKIYAGTIKAACSTAIIIECDNVVWIPISEIKRIARKNDE